MKLERRIGPEWDTEISKRWPLTDDGLCVDPRQLPAHKQREMLERWLAWAEANPDRSTWPDFLKYLVCPETPLPSRGSFTGRRATRGNAAASSALGRKSSASTGTETSSDAPSPGMTGGTFASRCALD